MSEVEYKDMIVSITKALKVVKRLKKSPLLSKDWPYHKFPFGLWFRGQPVAGMPLKPHVYREIELIESEQQRKKVKRYDETNLFEHLRLRVPSYQQTYRSAFDWLCLMQHYSLPTRLLDWSESMLPALYFAVNDKLGEDGELVVLNARKLNKIQKERPTICTSESALVVIRSEMAATRSASSLKRQASVLDAARRLGLKLSKKEWMDSFRKPIAVFPSRLNDRMIFQASVFTLHGGKLYIEEMENYYKNDTIPAPVSLETINKDEYILERYIIPGGKIKKKIQKDLFFLGVHEGTLFPEVDRQAVYLRQLWSYTKGKINAAPKDEA